MLAFAEHPSYAMQDVAPAWYFALLVMHVGFFIFAWLVTKLRDFLAKFVVLIVHTQMLDDLHTCAFCLLP
jgi:hypothetical protein